MAASDEAELVRMINTSTDINDRPCAFRYPRGTGIGSALPSIEEKIEIGKSKVIKEGKKLAILNFGARLNETLKAAENLIKKGVKFVFISDHYPEEVEERISREEVGELSVS